MQHHDTQSDPSRPDDGTPRYPNVRVRLTSRHPLAAVSAIRHALRRAGVSPREVRRFTEESLTATLAASSDVTPQTTDRKTSHVLRAWAVIDFVEVS